MAGGTITTGTHPKLLWPGVHTVWGQTYNEHPVEYTDFYDVADSSQAYETDVQVTGTGMAPIKPETQGISYDSEIQGGITNYVHIAYALGYKVSHEELKDNLYKQVAERRAKANAFSIAQTLENIGAFIPNTAFSSTYFTTWDGQPLISSVHLNASGGTFSNELSPGAEMSEASLEDMCIQIMGAQNDRGLQISVMPKSLHVHRSNVFNAARILNSVQQSGTANNDTNVLRDMRMFPGGAQVNHYLTNTGAWFVRTNVPNGMRMFWRERPEFSQDNDFDTKVAKAATYFRCSFGCTDPLGIYGSNGG